MQATLCVKIQFDISASKLWRPWSDTAVSGVRSVSILFACAQILDCKQQVDISASKLWRPWSDAASCGVRSGTTLSAYVGKFDSRLILVRCKLIFLQANCGDPDQTSLTVASALGLHYLLTVKIRLWAYIGRYRLIFLQANCEPWSDAANCGVRSGSTLFTSKKWTLGLYWYSYILKWYRSTIKAK